MSLVDVYASPAGLLSMGVTGADLVWASVSSVYLAAVEHIVNLRDGPKVVDVEVYRCETRRGRTIGISVS